MVHGAMSDVTSPGTVETVADEPTVESSLSGVDEVAAPVVDAIVDEDQTEVLLVEEIETVLPVEDTGYNSKVQVVQ